MRCVHFVSHNQIRAAACVTATTTVPMPESIWMLCSAMQVADLTGQLDSAEETLTELRAQLDTRDAAAKDAAEAQQKQVTELAAMRSAKDQSNAELAGANAERERLSAELASVKEALGATQAKLAGLAATAAKQPPQVLPSASPCPATGIQRVGLAPCILTHSVTRLCCRLRTVQNRSCT